MEFYEFIYQWRGKGGGGPGRIGDRRWEERGREAGFANWQEPGERRTFLQYCITFHNRNRTKRQESLRKGVGSRSNRYGTRPGKSCVLGVGHEKSSGLPRSGKSQGKTKKISRSGKSQGIL